MVSVDEATASNKKQEAVKLMPTTNINLPSCQWCDQRRLLGAEKLLNV